MRTLLSLASLAAVAALSGCAIIIAPNDDVRIATPWGSSGVVGDGQLTTDRRPVSAVQGLDVVGAIHMDVRVGDQPSLQIETDRNVMPMVRTEVREGTLKVWTEGSYSSNHGVRVIYTTPQLSQITSTGSGRLVVSNLNGAPLTFNKNGSGRSQLSGRVGSLNMQLNGSGEVDAGALQSSGNANLNLSGSGRISVGTLAGDAVNVNLRGSGALAAGGTVNHLNASVVGSGAANLKSLASQRADLKTNGSGDISARVGNSLVAATTGSGRITVYGNPADRNISGKNVDVLN